MLTRTLLVWPPQRPAKSLVMLRAIIPDSAPSVGPRPLIVYVLPATDHQPTVNNITLCWDR